MEIKSLFVFVQARDKPVRNYSNGEYTFNFRRSTSGKSVNEMTVMQTTAVYACVRILSEAIAPLPIHVMLKPKVINRKKLVAFKISCKNIEMMYNVCVMKGRGACLDRLRGSNRASTL